MPRDQQAVCHDDVRTVGRNEPSGKQRVCRERERSNGSPGEGSGCNDEGVQHPVRAQQEGTAHGEDDGNHLGGTRPSPVGETHPDDDEDQAQVLEDGAGARVRLPDRPHVGDLAGRQSDNRVDHEIAPVARRGDHLPMTCGHPVRAGKNVGEDQDSRNEHTEEADERQLDAVMFHEVVGGDTGGTPAQGSHEGHEIPKSVTHGVLLLCPRDDSNVRHPL